MITPGAGREEQSGENTIYMSGSNLESAGRYTKFFRLKKKL